MTFHTVICGDACKILLDAPIDTLIVDPPYSEHVHANAVSCGTGGLTGGRTRGVHDRDLGFESLSDKLMKTIARAVATTRRWSLIYSDVESLHLWRSAAELAGAEYIRAVPWVRWSQPQMSGDRPPTGCEMVSVFHAREGRKPKRKHWNGPGNLIELAHEEQALDLPGLRHKAMRGANKHATQKPLDQALDLVSYFSEPGECVADLVCGSGTVGVACALLGRSFVGVEIDEEWAVRARARILGARTALSKSDVERVERWIAERRASLADVPATPRSPAERPTWERAQRRSRDLELVELAIRSKAA